MTECRPEPATGFYLRRYYGWKIEVNIRSIKSTMQMDILRCKTPEMVEKEIWTHVLAYNLLRTVMAVAASEKGIQPCQVSFKGAKQVVDRVRSED